MIVINNVDSQKFSFNGVEYFKNFTPVVVGNKIRVLNTYDSSIELTDAPRLYSEFEVEGVVYGNVIDLQTALLPILYTRNSLLGDFLSSDITDYTDATTPLLGTELALIDDGTGFKKVAVSEFDNQNYLNLITDFPLNFDIIKENNKYIIPNLIEDEISDVQKWYYVKKSTGLDTNNGDLLTPFKTLKKALLEVQNNNTFSNYGIEILEDCIFYSQDLQGQINLYSKKLTITTEFNCVITSGLSGQTWALTAGKTNTYQTTALVNLCGVIDIRTSNYDNNGIPKPLLKVASIDLVESTPNSFFLSVDLKTAYVHTFDNSIPNGDVLAVRSNYDFRFNHGSLASTGVSVILNNLKFFGAQIYLASKLATQTSIDNFIAKDCLFSHGLMTNLLTFVDYDNVILQSCISAYALRDLNNYSPFNFTNTQKTNAVIIELNCKYNDAGIYAEATNVNNLSTAHSGINILRINCVGYNSKGPAITDVNGCRTINILLNIFDRNNTSFNGFYSDNLSAHRNGFLTLIDCFSDYNFPINSSVYTELYKTKILKNSTLTNFKLLN